VARGLQALGPPFRSIATIPQFGFVRRPAVFESRRRRPLARIAPDAEAEYRRFLATNSQFPICPQIAHGSDPPVIKQAGLCAVDFLRRVFIGSTSVMDAKSRDRVGRHAFGGTSLFGR
jgi:hypothetical protein